MLGAKNVRKNGKRSRCLSLSLSLPFVLVSNPRGRRQKMEETRWVKEGGWANGRRGNNANLSHVHRSGFVFRWIIGLPASGGLPAGQPTFNNASSPGWSYSRERSDFFARNPTKESSRVVSCRDRTRIRAKEI